MVGRRVGAAVVGLALVGAGAGGAARGATATFSVTSLSVPVVVGPRDDTHCTITADLYVPAGASAAAPVPAVIEAHGFGGSKADLVTESSSLARHGYEVLAYSALGFGGSTCNIEIDDPAYDGKAVRQLVSLLGNRPEVVKDGPDDPRVGMVGSSEGGNAQFAAVDTDPRIDAIVPTITWNDLGYALTPNNDSPRRVYSTSPPGVAKYQWASFFFGVGVTTPATQPGTTPVPPSTCPGFDPGVCPALADTLANGYPSPTTQAFLYERSPSRYLPAVRIPVMLRQGEADTLFNINDAVANYQGLAAQGVPVKLVLQSWGHSQSTPAPGEYDMADLDHTFEGQRLLGWFDRWLKHAPVDTGPAVEYFRDWVPYSGNAAPAYAGASSWPVGTAQTWYLSAPPGSGTAGALVASPGAVAPGTLSLVNPPGGQPASYSETSALQDRQPFASIPPSDPPGEAVTFSTPPLAAPLDVVGAPSATFRVSAPTFSGASPATMPVLFGKVYDVAPDGSLTLTQRLVSPIRIADASGAVRLTLPGIVHRFPAGHRLELALASTDAAYLASRVPGPIGVVADATARLLVPVVGGPPTAGGGVGSPAPQAGSSSGPDASSGAGSGTASSAGSGAGSGTGSSAGSGTGSSAADASKPPGPLPVTGGSPTETLLGVVVLAGAVLAAATRRRRGVR